MTTLEEQLAARKEVILRRRARNGSNFEGSKELRSEESRKRKEAARKRKQTMLEQDPMYQYKKYHWGMRPEHLMVFFEKGGSLEDLPENREEVVPKHFLKGPKKGAFKNRLKELRRKYRREGLPDSPLGETNKQPKTMKNPLGAGAPVKPMELSAQVEKSNKILETTQKVAYSGVDFAALPGFYDTKYDPDTKLHAVTSYIVTGSLAEASKFSAVPLDTIKYWRKTSQWWPAVANYVQQARQEELDSRMSGVIHEAMDVVVDRLKDGDYKYNAKLDKLVRVPVQAKEAATIASKAIVDRNLLRGDPTSRTDTSTLAEKVESLKQQFKSFTDQKVIDADVERIND